MRSKLHRSAFCVLLAFSGAAFAQEATEAAPAAFIGSSMPVLTSMAGMDPSPAVSSTTRW